MGREVGASYAQMSRRSDPIFSGIPSTLGLVIVTGLALSTVAGCTIEPGEDGLEIVPRGPYVSSPAAVDEQAWNGEPVSVDVERGNIEIVGNPDAKTIRVRVTTMTWARNRADASAIRAATVATAKLERTPNGSLSVTCTIPKGDFGSALNESTQCNIRIDIPAPEGVVHDIYAIARVGDVYMNRLQSGPTTQILASGIEVEGALLRGNVKAYSYYADVEVEPRANGEVVVASESGDWYHLPNLEEVEERDERDGSARYGATLRIPKDFTARSVMLASRGAAVEALGFPDVQSGMPRGPLGPSSAQSVTVGEDARLVGVIA